MKPSIVVRFLPLAAAVALVGCGSSEPGPAASPTPSGVATTAATAATNEIVSEAELVEQDRRERAARAAADPVVGVVERAELCLHFAGEEGFNAERRAQIDKAFADNRCDAVVADADALKATRPQDAAKLDEAVSALRQ